jgi:putative membrane protein
MHWVLSAWNFDPWVIGGLLLLVGLYARGVAVVWRRAGRGAVVSRARVVAFALGAYTLALAVVSPLDTLAHLLFSAHMVQHVLLMLIAAPLLVAGAPLLPLLWALPADGRLRVGRAWKARPSLRRAWHALTGPVVVWCVFTVTLWVWHLPGPYQAAVLHEGVHRLEHATMLGAALLFWWVVLQPVGRRRIDGGSTVLLIFATKVQSGTLGAIITFTPRPLYPVYEAGAAAFGLTPMQDQYMAGLIMGTVSGLAFVVAGAAVFLAWMRGMESRGRRPGTRATPTPALRGPPLELDRRGRPVASVSPSPLADRTRPAPPRA